MESINSDRRFTYVKGVVKFLRNKSTTTGKPMQMFAVVGEHTEVCSFFPDEAEDRFANGDRIEGIAANSNGYVTLKVYEKEPAHAAHAPTPKKKRGPKANPAATASTSKGKSLDLAFLDNIEF